MLLNSVLESVIADANIDIVEILLYNCKSDDVTVEEFQTALLESFNIPDYMAGNINSILTYLKSIATIRIGEIIMDDDFPNLEVFYTIQGKNGNMLKHKLGYLQPFRGYRFQISGTLRGEMDLGSSEVCGLGNIVDAYIPVKGRLNGSQYASNIGDLNRYFLELLAKEALYQLAGNRYGNGAEVYLKPYVDGEVFAEYLDKVIEYLK